MAGSIFLMCMKVLVLVTLLGCRLMGGVRAATLEEIGKLVKGPLWNQTSITLESLSGPIPPELGSLTNLTYLYLGSFSGSNLSGPIPPELGKLTNLAYLNFGSNRLSGPIPPELGNLRQLTYLNLGDNSLSGPIPPELSNLTKLESLYLDRNNLSGRIPSWLGSLIYLTGLDLANNNFCGPIPSELGSLVNLIGLYIGNNSLSGPLPPQLGNLANLVGLWLQESNLSGPIPPQLGNLSKLRNLALYNNSLSGPIPPELGRLTNLENVFLSNNSLSGPLPQELGSLAKLTVVNLSKNNISGPIPAHWGNLTKLTFLNLADNNLSGPIPPQLGRLLELEYLYLSNNALSGPIPPEFGNLTSLSDLALNNNSLSGPIPPSLGSLRFSLRTLYLYSNNLSGPIPLDFGNLTSLSELALNYNSLSGPIPPSLGSLRSSLRTLYLYNNNLSGPIPPQLGNLSSLGILALDDNNLSGPIPPELGNLTQLRYLSVDRNNLSGSIPAELGRLTGLVLLTLSNNRLSGPTPPELGRLTRLDTLLLSNNNLSGAIFPGLGNLTRLQQVSLEYTNMTRDRVNLTRLGQLEYLGLPCVPSPSLLNTSMTYLALVLGNQANADLDLSWVPYSCKLVNLTGSQRQPKNIQFWKGCDTSCVVNLDGLVGSLSRSTRRKVCLHKISVFLQGDVPYRVYDDEFPFAFSKTLKNGKGRVFNLSDPNFVDTIDLGPQGRAYTGVGSTKVQAGNLCGNPEAERVSAILFVVFAAVLVVMTALIIVVARWRRRIRGSGLGSEKKSNYGSLKRAGLYLWGAALAVLPVVDLATDFLVLSDVWGAWPMWVVLASISAPFLVGAYMVAMSWASNGFPVRGPWKALRLKWLWPLPELAGMDGRARRGSFSSWLLAILVLPVGLVGVLVQDLLSVAEKFGLHVALGDHIVVFERYHGSRVLVELLLESLPQAIFQTALYLIGSSRATRIYIDQRIFVQSIVLSLLSLSMQYFCMLWEAVYESRSLGRVFLDRFKNAGQPVILKTPDGFLKDEEPVIEKDLQHDFE